MVKNKIYIIVFISLLFFWQFVSVGFANQINIDTLMTLGETKFNEDLGLYEVILNKQIFYVSKNKRFLIVGNVIDFKTGKNLTKEKRPYGDGIDVSSIKKHAITVGTGKWEISVFIDPLCTVCKDFILNEVPILVHNDFKINIFLHSLSNKAENKSIIEGIWCSEDTNDSRYKSLISYLKEEKKINNFKTNSFCDKTPLNIIKSFAESNKFDVSPVLIMPDKSVLYSGSKASIIIMAVKMSERRASK